MLIGKGRDCIILISLILLPPLLPLDVDATNETFFPLFLIFFLLSCSTQQTHLQCTLKIKYGMQCSSEGVGVKLLDQVIRTRETQFKFTTMELYQKTLGLFPSIQATCLVLGKTEGEPTMHLTEVGFLSNERLVTKADTKGIREMCPGDLFPDIK